MLTTNKNSNIPIGKQLFNEFKKLILTGVFKEDEQLPSVRNIALEAMVNPNTILKVYQELEKEGLIYAIPQKGYYVSKVSDAVRLSYQKELEDKFINTYKDLLALNLSKEYLLKLL